MPTSWIKYFLIISFIVGALVFAIFAGLKHQANVSSTQDVDIGLKASNVGLIREDMSTLINRDEAVAETFAEIASNQKNYEGDTLVEYVFLDKDGNPTDDEEKINSIQFKVQLVNKKGKVESTSIERVELHKLGGVK